MVIFTALVVSSLLGSFGVGAVGGGGMVPPGLMAKTNNKDSF